MQRALPVARELPLLDVASTRMIEQRAGSALPEHTLMQRAGESVARLALALAPHAKVIWIATGPGNNGGDGLEAAIHLLRWGKNVRVSLFGDRASLPADAQRALTRAIDAGVSIGSDATGPADAAQLAIDALLGIGASRAPEGSIALAIRHLNALVCPVLAVDVPSGLHPDTGQPFGEEAVVANHTLAMLTLKPGLFTGAGRDHAGTVWLDTLGIDASSETPKAWLSGTTHGNDSAPRRHAQHKGSFGDVRVIGGAAGMSGAALLAARAAHAAGAGRVYVELLDDSHSALCVDPLHPELMVRHDGSHAEPEALAHSTVVCGCGGGDRVRSRLPRVLSAAKRLVLDADALNAIAADSTLAALLRARAPRGSATVLTPHPLEAARLLACPTASVQADRLGAARELCDRFGCVIVLKGSGSLIAAPGHIPRVNSTGNAALATAGTGDVLAGWLGGLWAQCAAGDEATSAFRVAIRAVAEHGAAAPEPPTGPLRASELIERLASPRRCAAVS